METVKLRSRTDADGILHLQVPVNNCDRNYVLRELNQKFKQIWDSAL